MDIRRGRLTTMLKVLDVEGAVERTRGGWVRTAAPWSYDEERHDRVRAARRTDQEQVLAYGRTASCLMAFLRRALHDPDPAAVEPCGRCANCTGAFPGPASLDPSAVAAAGAFLRGADVVLEARKMWPSGLEEPKGKIPDAARALDGRALAEAHDAGWAAVVEELLAAGPDAEVADEVVRAVAGVLKRWGWPAGRPTWVTWVPSRHRPALAASLACRLGEVGRLLTREALVRTRNAPPQVEMANSAHACANVRGAFALRGPVPPGPVLVVDDTWSSGWTMTEVAAVLGGAGAGPVYPLVLRRG